jgi:hypothetical protein
MNAATAIWRTWQAGGEGKRRSLHADEFSENSCFAAKS